MNKNTHQCGTYNNLKDELITHLPFSLFSVIISISFTAIFCFVIDFDNIIEKDTHTHITSHNPKSLISLFELFHYMHILFSGAATTALLFRKKANLFKSLSIGICVSIIFCTISDTFIPWLANFTIQGKLPLHISAFEHFHLSLTFASLGSIFGLLLANTQNNATILSHSAHVIFSSLGSLFYIISFTEPFLWLEKLHLVFAFTLIAVTIPCCLSDFYIPMLFIKNKSKKIPLK